MSKVTVKTECESCGGTGLYIGMAEANNAAVICRTCEGTGCDTISYTPFERRKGKRGVDRVFHSSCGYMISAEDITTSEGVLIRFSQGGCSYKDWISGKGDPKTPIKDLYCPYIWNNRGMGNEPLPKCKTILGSSISGCKHFKNKAKCWEEFEAKR